MPRNVNRRGTRPSLLGFHPAFAERQASRVPTLQVNHSENPMSLSALLYLCQQLSSEQRHILTLPETVLLPET
jgi:hypothetical protein